MEGIRRHEKGDGRLNREREGKREKETAAKDNGGKESESGLKAGGKLKDIEGK